MDQARHTLARQWQAFLVSAHIFDLALNQPGWAEADQLSFGFAAMRAGNGGAACSETRNRRNECKDTEIAHMNLALRKLGICFFDARIL